MKRSPAQRHAAKINWRKLRIKGIEAQVKQLCAELEVPPSPHLDVLFRWLLEANERRRL